MLKRAFPAGLHNADYTQSVRGQCAYVLTPHELASCHITYLLACSSASDGVSVETAWGQLAGLAHCVSNGHTTLRDKVLCSIERTREVARVGLCL